MNFCRQCGAPVGMTPDQLERPTAVFNQPGLGTQRLDPRPTGSRSGQAAASIPAAAFGVKPSGSWKGPVIVGIIMAVAVTGLFGVVKYGIKPRIHTNVSTARQVDHKALVYPGARTMLDVTSGSGTGVLQLQTNDDIDKVADWYLEHLKPTKTVRVGPMVVLKNGSVTATIVSDSGSTNIMIKQTP